MPQKPHISVIRGPRWNSLIGFYDSSKFIRWYECVDKEATGSGATPKEAYDSWYKAIFRPYQHGPIFLTAFKLANTPR